MLLHALIFFSVAKPSEDRKVGAIRKILRFLDQGFFHGFETIQHHDVSPAVLKAVNVSILLM